MIDTAKIQRCGCEQDDCVEILGLEDSIYACFTCGYAGVTPSGADRHEDEIHIGDLLAEVKRLREGIEKALIPTDKVPWAHELFKLSGLRDALKELIE